MPDRSIEQVDPRAAATAASHRWWYEHGGGWSGEVEQRRATMPCYYLQEIFLATYLGECRGARVLEFGCGFGRHLRYLATIPEIAVFGCDQSPSMLAGLVKLEPDGLSRRRVCQVMPTGGLPYRNGTFDVIFTNSVLIHIPPEHLPAVLRELVRVCRGHLLHLENPPTSETHLTSAEHDGCWAHPLPDLYRLIGLQAEVLPAPDAIQGCYRAVVDRAHQMPIVTPQAMEASQRLDAGLSATIAELQRRIETEQADRKTERAAHQAAQQAAQQVAADALRDTQSRLAQLRDEHRQLERRWREFVGRLEGALARTGD